MDARTRTLLRRLAEDLAQPRHPDVPLVERPRQAIAAGVRLADGWQKPARWSVVALLGVCALAPIASAALTSGAASVAGAITGQLGNIGSGYLTGLLAGFVQQETRTARQPSRDMVQDLYQMLEDCPIRHRDRFCDDLTALMRAVGTREAIRAAQVLRQIHQDTPPAA